MATGLSLGSRPGLGRRRTLWYRRSRAAVLLLAALAVIPAGCGPVGGQSGGASPVPRQTPQASASTEQAATAALLSQALAAAGIRLDHPAANVQPGEPASVASAARALFRADVHDPEGGYVIVYQFGDPEVAAARGAEFRDYLQGGPGQVNYPLDAQFSLAQVGSTLVFTWWSRERSADPTRAELAFDTMASVGQAIPILK